MTDLKWPFGLQRGEWSWRSFTAGMNAGKTIITIYCTNQGKGGLQYWMILDWSDYDANPEAGRGDAEDNAKLICTAVNQYMAANPNFQPS